MQTVSADEQAALLTVPEVAARLRMHQTSVTKMCRDGVLGAFRAGSGRGRWRIPAAGVDAYNARRTPRADMAAA